MEEEGRRRGLFNKVQTLQEQVRGGGGGGGDEERAEEKAGEGVGREKV